MSNNDRIEFTLDDGDIIEVALEALIDDYEAFLSDDSSTPAERRESQRNLRVAKEALSKVQRLFQVPEQE